MGTFNYLASASKSRQFYTYNIFMATPYLTTDEAYAVTKRLEKNGLIDHAFFVQLVPATMPEVLGTDYVLRYYADKEAEQPVALVRFMAGAKKSKNSIFIKQLLLKMEQQQIKWLAGEYKPNSELLRLLPTLSNTRRYKLQLLIGAAV